MRLADLDELINKAINLEAVALEQTRKYEPLDNPSEWRTWSAILTERSAFKFDLMDAPIIEAEPIRHGHWIYKKHRATREAWIGYYVCSECGRANWIKEDKYCSNCGAKMEDLKNDR